MGLVMNNVDVKVGNIRVGCFSSINDLISNSIYTGDGIKPGFAIAINPEKVIAVNQSPELSMLIESASIRYPDGVGVSYVMSKKTRNNIPRIPGCELWESLMLYSASFDTPVFLLGANSQVSKHTSDKLVSLGVNVVGSHDGFFDNEETIINAITSSKAKIVTVAMGSPRQEQFINKCRKSYPDAFYMGVGGTYDVYTGVVKRAPSMFCKLHLEWLYRLLQQPSRIFRQTNLLKFLLLYISGRL